MKIVNLKEFLAMPPGTVFAKYAPQFFEGIAIKGDTLPNGNDFFYQDIATSFDASDCCEAISIAETTGEDLPLDLHCESRDGSFKEEQLFAVYSASDVLSIITRLEAAMSDGYP